jgi:hypothetical protein
MSVKNPVRKGKILGLALVCFAVCAGGALMMLEQSGWRHSEGEIVAIKIECGMRARQGDYVYTADIPCESVAAFQIVNADKEWRITEKYQSTVQFAGADGAPEQTLMTLYKRDGRTPAVGDKFPVLQNPANPTEVVKPDAGMTVMLTVGAGMLCAIILFFFFRGKPAQRKRSAPVFDEAADERERGARADAMIAAALARREAEMRGAPRAPAATARSVLPQSGRGGFGRKS